jgi:hypothetical protein
MKNPTEMMGFVSNLRSHPKKVASFVERKIILSLAGRMVPVPANHQSCGAARLSRHFCCPGQKPSKFRFGSADRKPR